MNTQVANTIEEYRKVSPSKPQHERPVQVTMLLLPGFSMLATSGFCETLATANRILGRAQFSWLMASEDGAPVHSSCGMAIPTKPMAERVSGQATLILSGAGPQNSDASASFWIRSALHRFVRHGGRIGALGEAIEFLTMAGCTQNRTIAVHWRYRAGFTEKYPDQDLCQRPFVVDERVMSAVGATSGIDLALCLIEEQCGEDIVRVCADELCYAAQQRLQRLTESTHPALSHLGHDKLRKTIAEMEKCIDDPPSIEYFADLLSLSQRQLERLFARYLDTSPKRYFDNMRLERAHELLLQTDMRLSEIAIATGFGSNSLLSKHFRRRFNATPQALRQGNAKPATERVTRA
ncbi:GlxA family transcriptional regulator [Ruegeria jejuensis]|uniref:GlxA family transcriptional regulator n=1 Tax=Ruegeria jejuensis TaxID=3233338 RepID=UPI00355AEAC4